MLKKIAVAMAAGGLLIAASPVRAGGHVSLSLGVGIPLGGYGYSAPAYYGPPPVIYAPPPVVYSPPPVVYSPDPYYGRRYAPGYNAPGYYGPGYYGPGYYGPRVIYRPLRPYYDGRHGGWHERGDWHR